MALYNKKNLLEAGIDEVARGCLAGPVVSAAVIAAVDPCFLIRSSYCRSRPKEPPIPLRMCSTFL